MDWDAIGAMGEIIGAAAVVLTLGYLAAQTRQARMAAHEASRCKDGTRLRTSG